VVQAHLHPTQRRGQVVEPSQGDLSEVVDRHPEEVLHRLHRLPPAGFAPRRLQGVLVGDPGAGQGVFAGRLLQPVGLLDLHVVVVRDTAHRHIVIAGNGERAHPGTIGGAEHPVTHPPAFLRTLG